MALNLFPDYILKFWERENNVAKANIIQKKKTGMVRLWE